MTDMSMDDRMKASRDIRAEITARRIEDIKRLGPSQGIELPEEREVPLTSFLGISPVICEIKRKSPSVKNIDTSLDPVELARKYYKAGIRNISILTEQNYFGGSLTDLIKVKKAFPHVAVLRKDFLVSVEDIDISYRAGADACLLIASLLETDVLTAMHKRCGELGITALVELHDQDDVIKAENFKPELTGINSRNLKTFTIDPLQPLKIRSLINWPCRVVYESGIKTGYDIDFVSGSGFGGVLVGESAVKNPDFTKTLLERFIPECANGRFAFWTELCNRYRPGRPLVKICGITKRKDLIKVKELGADMAGFILADSPRRVDADFINSCSDLGIMKVGVVVLKRDEELPQQYIELLESGTLDAIQFHGDEGPEIYLKYPGYKAFRIKDKDAAAAAAEAPGAAVLIDAFSKEAHGGTGKQIDSEYVSAVAGKRALWLAGGINPDNVCGLIREYSPALIDISSGVESAPGIKDHQKLEELFQQIEQGVG